ncbi:tyrosine-type recombinase/integrase [Phaeobacter inhibens]|uniref:tyrosine-type recombinase/integrase n=1 Tax=Phaeobacter inhibens TaxID=221822 RepID=UPI0021A8181E|nr:tyrosine-type recombinase/integrase [Phaeobacter inhibens]UWR66169.1 tyrosine-type recombinase/integrase [Phaeobacter inhibens]
MSNKEEKPKNIFKPRNSKYWWLRVKINGFTHRETLRTTSQRVAAKKAKDRIKELRGKEESGELDWTFAAGFTKFFNALDLTSSSWGSETRKRYQSSLRQILRVIVDICEDADREIEDLMAAEITVATVSEFVARRRAEKVTVSTINRDLTAFTSLMSSIKNQGWIDENPVRLFEKQGMKEVLPVITLPSNMAIQKLSARAPGTLHYFPSFLDATGGRVTEMALLLWADVSGLDNPVEGNVKATLRNTKGKKVRAIELRQQAIDILLKIPRSNVSPYIFWNSTEHGYYKDPSNLFWEYGQETGFDARLHDLRHKFAIERLKEGWSIYRVQKYIGHGSVLTTERYYLRYLTAEEKARVSADGDNGFR